MANFSPSAHWRDSARHARFFAIDARAAFPLLLFLLHIQLWTFIIAIVAMIFFFVIENYGLTVPVFLRLVRARLAGHRRYATPWWER